MCTIVSSINWYMCLKEMWIKSNHSFFLLLRYRKTVCNDRAPYLWHLSIIISCVTFTPDSGLHLPGHDRDPGQWDSDVPAVWEGQGTGGRLPGSGATERWHRHGQGKQNYDEFSSITITYMGWRKHKRTEIKSYSLVPSIYQTCQTSTESIYYYSTYLTSGESKSCIQQQIEAYDL